MFKKYTGLNFVLHNKKVNKKRIYVSDLLTSLHIAGRRTLGRGGQLIMYRGLEGIIKLSFLAAPIP